MTIPDPSDTLGDPVVEQTMKKLIETAGRLVANRNAPGSGVTAPYGTNDDTGRVQLSQDAMTKERVLTLQTRSSKIPDRKIRGMPAKIVSRVIDVQKNNQLKYNFTEVPDTDSSDLEPSSKPVATATGDIASDTGRVLQNLRTSLITTVMVFGGATIVQVFRMVELMNLT